MKKLLILITCLAIFIINITFGLDCKSNQNPHDHNEDNVPHQLYEAWVETPKDALAKGAHATAELLEATAELVVEPPIKTLVAVKNGIKKGYHIMIEKPITVAKEVATELAHRIKCASKTIAHGDQHSHYTHDDHEEHEPIEDTIATFDDIYVLIVENHKEDRLNAENMNEKNACIPCVTVQVTPAQLFQSEPPLDFYPVQYLKNVPELSEKTLMLLGQVHHQLVTDLPYA